MSAKQGTLKTCPTCGGKVSSTAPTCPHCGELRPGQTVIAPEVDVQPAAEDHDHAQIPSEQPSRPMGLKMKKLLDIVTSIVGVFLIVPGIVIMFGVNGTIYSGGFLVLFGLFTMPHLRDRVLPKLGKRPYSWKGTGMALMIFIVGLGVAGITDTIITSREQAAKTEETRLAKEAAERLHQEKVAEWTHSGAALISEANLKLAAGDYELASRIVKKYEGVGGDELAALAGRAREVEIEQLSKSAELIPESDYRKKIAAYQRLVELEPKNTSFQSALKKYQDAHSLAQQEAAEVERQKKVQALMARAKSLPAEPYEANLDVYKQLQTLDPKNKTYVDKVDYYQGKIDRKKRIEHMFSTWDGSHPPLVKYVKEKMNDPSSFDHIETRYGDKGNYILIVMKFRGKNAFGGLIINQVTAKVEFNGDTNHVTVLSWD